MNRESKTRSEVSKFRVSICFFGITRSLSHTIASIERNVIAPAQEQGEVTLYAHFFRQHEIANARSAEQGQVDLYEHRLLAPDWLELEEPDTIQQQHDFEYFKQYGDRWGDDFRSLRNLFHQLHSVRKVTKAALADRPDIVIFARPDLHYHDSLSPFIAKAIEAASRNESLVLIPNWQCKRVRLNDRFAICVGQDAAASYGCRIDQLKSFCHARNIAPQPESLVKCVLDGVGIPVSLIRARASRVRVDGKMVREDFTPKRLKEMKEALGYLFRPGRGSRLRAAGKI